MRRMRHKRALKKIEKKELSKISDYDLDSDDLSDDLSSDDSDFDFEEDEFPKINDHFAGISFSGWDKGDFSINLTKSNSKIENSNIESCVSSTQDSMVFKDKNNKNIAINGEFSETEDCSEGKSLSKRNKAI